MPVALASIHSPPTRQRGRRGRVVRVLTTRRPGLD